MKPLRALTLWRPWPWAIIHVGKDLENRDWTPSPGLLAPGDYLAIHAGRTFDEDAVDWLEDCCSGDTMIPAERSHTQGIVAVARFAGVVEESDSPWFFGRYGWLLRDVVALPEPVPCRGAQGLWTVPPDVLPEVRRQYRAGLDRDAARQAAGRG